MRKIFVLIILTIASYFFLMNYNKFDYLGNPFIYDNDGRIMFVQSPAVGKVVLIEDDWLVVSHPNNYWSVFTGIEDYYVELDEVVHQNTKLGRGEDYTYDLYIGTTYENKEYIPYDVILNVPLSEVTSSYDLSHTDNILNIISRFGFPMSKFQNYHLVEVKESQIQPLLAGEVITVLSDMVEIKTDKDLIIRYMFMDSVVVQVGDQVTSDDFIGKSHDKILGISVEYKRHYIDYRSLK